MRLERQKQEAVDCSGGGLENFAKAGGFLAAADDLLLCLEEKKVFWTREITPLAVLVVPFFRRIAPGRRKTKASWLVCRSRPPNQKNRDGLNCGFSEVFLVI